MSTSKIEQELLSKTGVRASRDRVKMLNAIIKVVGAPEYIEKDKNGDIPWEQLSEEAQVWYNDADAALDRGEPPPDFPDHVQDEPEPEPEPEPIEEPSDEPEEEEVDMRTAKKSNGAKRAASREPAGRPLVRPPTRRSKMLKATPAPRKRVGTGEREVGARIMIMREVLKKPHLTNAELHEFVQKRGSDASPMSVSAMRHQFRQAVAVLKEEGLLKKSLDV